MSMKVALLNSEWYPKTGGGVIHVHELATRLVKNHGCEVDIIVKKTGYESGSLELPEQITVVQVPRTDSRLLNEIRYTATVLDRARQQEYDVVHSHTNMSTFSLQILHLFNDKVTILTVHGADLNFKVTYADSSLDSVYTFIRRIILRRFTYDGVISVSKELRSVLSKHHGTVEYIPNGVSVDEFPLPDGYGNKEILFVGRLRPKKNPTDIVKAMNGVIAENPDASLHIVGTGPLQNRIEQVVADQEVDEVVTVHGRVSDDELHELYRRCSVFVLPSDWEGHPLVLLEAWASGMTVIGTDVEGIREFLNKVDYGELVPLDTPDQLATAISSALSHPDQLKQNGEQAREFVRKNYDWDTTVQRTFDLYQQLSTDTEHNSAKMQSGVNS